MKKRIMSFLGVLLLVLSIGTMPVYATSGGERELFVDYAQTCTEEEQDQIRTKLAEISEKQGCEIIILTTESTDGKSIEEYADDYYDESGYGYGADKDGILFAIDVTAKEWVISTRGMAIEAFTDAGQEYLMKQVIEALSESDWTTAFTTFVDLCDDYLTQAHKGTPYDVGNLPEEVKSVNLVADVGIGAVLGIIAAFCVVSKDKSELKTVRKKSEAKDYMREGSLVLTARQESFLYRTVNKVEKDKGGSSTHKSSSGATHGGSSGKF